MSEEYNSPFGFDDNMDDISSGQPIKDDDADSLDTDLFSSSDDQMDLNNFAVHRDRNDNNDKHNGKSRKTRTKKKKKKALQIFLSVVLVFVIAFALVISGFAIYIFGFMNNDMPEDLNELQLNYTTTVYVKDKTSGEYTEYQRLHGGENRIWVSYDNMSDNLKYAFVCIEDQRFFDHNGVDWKRTISAFANMFVDIYSSNQGGSTITQQLVKNLTGDKEQNAMRKVREIMRARYLEENYSKDVILECYLNTASFSNGICGVEVASNFYFNKHTKDLTLAECASLAAIVKYPEKYRPDTHYEDNTERRKLVLAKMLELGKISKEDYDRACAEQVKIVADHSVLNEKTTNNYFVDAIIDQVVNDLVEKYDYEKKHAENLFYNGGYKIYCTMDTDIQKSIDDVFTNKSYFPKKKDQTAQASITVMDYEGHVVGICGGSGEKTGNRSLNRATSSPRSPGSTMKPMGAYAPALEENMITYSTLIADKPIGTNNGKKWPPNWYHYYGGSVTVAKALERSVNTVPAYLVMQLGLDKSYDFLHDNLGITTLVKTGDGDLNYSSLALGGCSVGITTLEQCAAYATFGNLGYYYKPTFYTQVTDQHGKVILEQNTNPTVAMSEDTAYIMNKLLNMPVYGSQGTGRTAASYVPNQRIYCKTGTTDSTQNVWFVGGTPYYVASCWYGYDMPDTISDQAAALKLWGRVMQPIHKNLEAKDYPQTNYVTMKRYCATTGLVATSGCPIGGTGYYKNSYMPQCTTHGGKVLDSVSSTFGTSSETSSKSSSTSSSATSSKTTSSKKSDISSKK
ncbi:MAG: transglycosylase domain-containing protein, partial [Oscillospiraceae bacterium]|nr:transglycosylase domain-containing protein [Candidatus Equicaccousia limihippi]